jgi:hypothetical protein
VLAEDRAILEAHNLSRREEHRFQLDALPEPYLGPVDAPMVLLNLNPGFDPSDLVSYATEARSSMMRRCLTHELDPDEAFYFLTDEFRDTGGWLWWTAKLRPLIEAVGMESVRRGVQVIEQVPTSHAGTTASREPCPPRSTRSSWPVRRWRGKR